MQSFRKQESTNISPRKVRFCLTSVLQIIIMKKLHRGVAQMVARMVRDHEAASSSLATPTMQSVLIGSEYPVMDTLLFYFLKSSYCNLFRGVAECYAFSRFHDNVGLRDLPAIRHIKGTDAVIVNMKTPPVVLLGGVLNNFLSTYSPQYVRLFS